MTGKGITALAMLLLALPVAAQEETEGIRIQGVEERPGVMHLKAWRLPGDAPMEEPSTQQGRFGDFLHPVDDANYRRYLRYRSEPGALLQALPEAAPTGETR
ncbi:hypothetical protein ACMDCT_14630 [Halomonadaceae bacterium KBTZ08]